MQSMIAKWRPLLTSSPVATAWAEAGAPVIQKITKTTATIRITGEEF